MSQTQSLTLIDEQFIDVARAYPTTFQRSSFVSCEKKSTESIYASPSLIFCKSLLRQAATPFGIVPVTFDLTVPSTFSVLMWGIFYDNGGVWSQIGALAQV